MDKEKSKKYAIVFTMVVALGAAIPLNVVALMQLQWTLSITAAILILTGWTMASYIEENW